MKSEGDAALFAAKVLTAFLCLLLLTIAVMAKIGIYLHLSIAFAGAGIVFGAYATVISYFEDAEKQLKMLLVIHFGSTFVAMTAFLASFSEWIAWLFAFSVLFAHFVLTRVVRENRKRFDDKVCSRNAI